MSATMKSTLKENYNWGNDRMANSKCVSSRCVAIILLPKSTSNQTNRIDAENTNCNGQEIFDDFVTRNKTCYWNPGLVESVKSLRYQGFMHPNTLLVGGDELCLDNLRTAWGRRVLNAPANFIIDKIGDINPIEMEVIPQTNFISLPEALCVIILDLNSSQVIATLDMIKDCLVRYYGNDTQLPSDQLIYDTLGKLIRERKAFHTGSGYFVVTPDTYRLRSDDLPNTYTTQVSYHPMYAQPPQPRVPMKAIPCQANTMTQPSTMYNHPSTMYNHPQLAQYDHSKLSQYDHPQLAPYDHPKLAQYDHPQLAPYDHPQVAPYDHPQLAQYDPPLIPRRHSTRGPKSHSHAVYSDGSSRDSKPMTLPRNFAEKWGHHQHHPHAIHSDGSTRDGRPGVALARQAAYSDGSTRDGRPGVALARQAAYSDGSTREVKTASSRHSGEVRSQGKTTYSDGSARDPRLAPAPVRKPEEQKVVTPKKVEAAKAKTKKVKGPRMSLLSKLFGRNKKKKKPTVQSASTKAVEYATFSGQFPPPEWAWYQQQVEKQQRVEDWITQVRQVPAPPTWQQSQMTHAAQTERRQVVEPVVEHKPPHRKPPPSSDALSRRKQRSRSLPRGRRPLQHISENTQQTLDDSMCTVINPAHRDQEMLTFATPSTIPPGDSFVAPSSVNVRIWPRHSSPILAEQSDCRDSIAPVHVINNDLGAEQNKSSFARRAHRARRRQLRYSGVFVSVNAADMSHEYVGHQSRTERVLSRSQDSGVNCVGMLGPNVSYATLENSPPPVINNNHDAKTSPSSPTSKPSHEDAVAPPRAISDIFAHRKFADIPEESPQKLNVSRASPDPTGSERSCGTVVESRKLPEPGADVKLDVKPVENEPSDSGFLSHNCDSKTHTSHDSKHGSHTGGSQAHPPHDSKQILSTSGSSQYTIDSTKASDAGAEPLPLSKHDDAIMSDIKNFQNIWKNAEKRLSKEIHSNNDHNFHSLDSLLDKDAPLNNQKSFTKDSSTSSQHSNVENVCGENMEEKLLQVTRKFNMNGDFQIVGVL